MKSKIHENNKNYKIMSKKSILIMALAIALGTTVSCNKKEETTKTATEHEGHNHKEGEAHKVAYECPMDCEKGKTYDEKGTCPVCKMELIEAKGENHEGHDHETENHEGHDHSEENHDGHNH
jgi:hypothetical protein